MYARIVERKSDFVVVTIDPYENPSNTFNVDLSEVWALPSFCDMLLGDQRGLLKLVYDPFQV